MPVLRMPGDDTLGQYLGSMADAWGQAYDPMARARAGMMSQQMQTSAFDLAKAKALDAANQNAATVYMNIPHPNDDPAVVAETAAAIRRGEYNPEQWANAATTVAKLSANRAAAGAIQPGDPEFSGYTNADIASARAQAIAGAPLPVFRSQQATATKDTNVTNLSTGAAAAYPKSPEAQGQDPATVLAVQSALAGGGGAPAIGAGATATSDVAKTNQIIDAANKIKAGAPLSEIYPALSAAQTFTSPNEAAAITARGQFLGLGDVSTPADINAKRDLAAAGNLQVQSIENPESVASAPFAAKYATAVKALPNAIDQFLRARGPGEIAGGAYFDLNDMTVHPLAPGQSAPDPSQGFIVFPPRAADAATIRTTAAAEEAGKEGAEGITKANTAQIEDALEGGVTAQRLQGQVARLRELLPYIDNDSAWSQAKNTFADAVQREFGVTITPGQSARNVYENIVNALLPSMKDDYGFRQVARPEIELARQSLPIGSLDKPALTRIVNALDAGSRMNRDVASAAMTARRNMGPDGMITPQAANDFIAKRQAMSPMDYLNQVRKEYPETPLKKSVGGFDAQGNFYRN